MPRDGNGTYSLPSSYLATTGQTIITAQHNPPFEDVANALTGSLPRNGSAAMQGNLPMAGYRITGLGAAQSDGDAVPFSQVSGLVPPGVIFDYVGASAPPGFLLCYGQEVSRSTYASLFAVVGTMFGAGDGATTFNVPDYRGRVLAGRDNMGGTAANRLTASGGVVGTTLGAAGGAEMHTLTLGQMPIHDHGGGTGLGGGHTVTGLPDQPIGATGGPGNMVGNGGSLSGFAHTHPIPSQGGGAAHPNVQPTGIVSKIIKF